MADNGDNKGELCGRVRYLKDTQGLSLRQIAREMGISRNKATALYNGTWGCRQPRGFILAPYHDLIAEWFRQVPSLKAVQVWKRLAERQVPVSRRAVEEYTEVFRRLKKPKIHWPLTFLPGEEAQVDWFFLNHLTLGRLCGFTLILSHSRFAFAHLFVRHGFEFFIEGHLMAFSAMNGTPMALRYDNLRSVVIKRQPLTYNAAFLEFANYYGLEIRLCNPASGFEKGRVERLIRSIRDTFENTAATHQSLGALNSALHDWIREKNATVHRATGAVPNAKKLEEKLRSLPANPYPNVVVHAGKSPTKTGLIVFDTNSYSIPAYCRNETISVHAGVDHVDFIDGKGKKIATHPRCFKKRQTLINPLHRSVSQLSERAKRERIYAVMHGMSDGMAVFLDQNAGVGEDAYATAHVLFKLLKTAGRSIIESLAREAVRGKSPRLKFIMSALNLGAPKPADPVSPQNQELLALDYKPRPLEDYNVDTDEKTCS
jgi:transposase